MSFTLADLTYRTARVLGTVYEGTATGGSTTTLIDTNARTESDDYWNSGTAWVLHDAAGAGAAPEGEYSVISDFVNSTATATLQDALTTAIASGDKYAVGKKRFPLNILIQSVNRALQEMGPIPTTDTSSLTTAADQLEYTLPIAANFDLRQVWMQTYTLDSDRNYWTELYPGSWYVQRTAAGTADTLVFREQPAYTYDLKLVYMAMHTELVDYNDTLSETVDIRRVIPAAAFYAFDWYRQKTRTNTKAITDEVGRYEQKMKDAERMYPIPAPRKSNKILIVSKQVEPYHDISDISTVRL